jgi:hypothetical protein
MVDIHIKRERVKGRHFSCKSIYKTQQVKLLTLDMFPGVDVWLF